MHNYMAKHRLDLILHRMRFPGVDELGHCVQRQRLGVTHPHAQNDRWRVVMHGTLIAAFLVEHPVGCVLELGGR